jgi:hypothetical protein
VVLEKGTTFSWFTTTFWSDDAANTVRWPPKSRPDEILTVTVHYQR